MTVVNPDSIAGITSVTSSGTTLEFYDVNGNLLDVSANLTGQLTVGTGATINSPATNVIDFETNGSERLRIGSSGQIGIAGANYGSSGQVLTSAGSGSAVSWSTIPAQATIANNADNRVITGGSGVNVNGETNLTFDHNQLKIECGNYSEPILINSTQSSVRATIRQTNNGNANSGLAIQKRHSTLHPANHWYGDISFEGWDGSGYHKGGLIECVANGTPANDNMPGELRFSTNSGGTGTTKILTITKDGHLYHTGGGNGRRYSFASDGSSHYMKHDTTLNGIILNGYGGIAFETNGTNERLRITSSGTVNIGGDYTQTNYPLQVNQGTDENRGLSIKNDEVGLNLGAHGSGHGYGREFSLNATRIDSGSLPFLRLGGQGGIKFCVDLNTERLRINSSGYVGVKRSTPLANLHTTNNELALGANPTSAAAPNATYDGLVVDGEAASFINIRSRGDGNNSYGRVAFSDDVRSRAYVEYRHKDGGGDDTMRFATAGAERLRIDSNGRLTLNDSEGIKLSAKTSSLYNLDGALSYYSTTNGVYLNGAGVNGWLRLQAAGTTNSRTCIDIYGQSHGQADVILFKTATSERLKITNGGDIDIAGRTFQMASFSATGSSTGIDSNPWSNNEIGIRMSHQVTGGQSLFAFYNPNGQVGYIQTSGSGTIYNTGSDYRLKENQVSISDGITRLKQLKPYRFNFKKDPSTTLDGFFAHEVQAVVPEAIAGTKDEVVTKEEGDRKIGDPILQGMDYGRITPLLTAALQEAIAKIETLEANIETLEANIETLESKVESIQTQQANDAAYEAKIDKLIDYFKL